MHADALFDFKKNVHQHLSALVRQDIARIQMLLKDLRASAGDETKSSVGDKYETARAMAHLEMEKLAHQLGEKEKLLTILSRYGGNRRCAAIEAGALVDSTFGLIYIAIHGGEIHHENTRVFCISGASPLAITLRGKKVGDSFFVKNAEYHIRQVV